jgi:hypothetical protein
MKNLFFILILIVLVYSCKKEDTTELSNESSFSSLEFIIIDTLSGNYDFSGSNFNISNDKAQWKKRIEIDIDNNGLYDIAFLSEIDNSPGGLNYSSIKLFLENSNISVVTSIKIDSTCSYYKTYTNNNEMYTVHYNTMYDASNENDSLFTMRVHRVSCPKIYSYGDSIMLVETYKDSTILINYYNKTRPIMGDYVNNYHYGIVDAQNKFIGLRFVLNDETYLGWIYLSISGSYIKTYSYTFKRVE